MDTALPLHEPTDEVLERICDAYWHYARGDGDTDGVHFRDVHQHNACNHTLSGTIDVDGIEYGFIIDNGDWNGTQVRAWGAAEDVPTYRHEPGEPLTFIPRNDIMGKVAVELYAYWQTQAWFTKLVSDYLYDRHFAPGGKIETHYREAAAKRGLEPGLLSSWEERVAQWRANGSPERADILPLTV